MTKIKTLGIREQAAWVRTCYPSFRCDVRGGLLVCRGQLQPTPVSRTYEVQVHYRVGTWPRVFVPVNQIQPLEPGGKIPHTYGADRPCIFYPDRQSWRSDMRLSHTIIPWLSLSLMFYEMWRATGEWYGGGVSHGDIEEIEPAA